MKNKLLARIAASAISVTMLGTVAFAAETGAMPSLSDVEGDATTKMLSFMDNGTNIIKPTVADGETAPEYVTMMSYLVSADATYADCDYVDEATTPMIALDQVTYADSFAAGVKVAASKLEANPTKQIVVKRGDSNGGTDKWLFAMAADNETITIMNGATATDIDVVDGVATLPKTATFNKTMVDSKYTMSLYSWVAIANDDATNTVVKEYLIPAEGDLTVNVSELEGKTLYAKFVCNCLTGDVTGDVGVDSKDINPIKLSALGKSNALTKFANKPLFEGSSIIIGDVTGDGVVDSKDINPVKLTALGKSNALTKQAGKPIYYVNK